MRLIWFTSRSNIFRLSFTLSPNKHKSNELPNILGLSCHASIGSKNIVAAGLHSSLMRHVFEAGAASILITSMVSKMNFACCSKPEGGYETESGGGSEMGTYTSLT